MYRVLPVGRVLDVPKKKKKSLVPYYSSKPFSVDPCMDVSDQIPKIFALFQSSSTHGHQFGKFSF